MQKVNTVLIVILAIAVIYLYSRPTGIEEPAVADATLNQTDSSETSLPMNGRIAYIDVDSLDANYVYLQDQRKALLEAQRKKQRSVENKLRRAEERFMQLQEQAPTMTPSQMESAQVELQQLDEQITAYREKMAQDLMEMEMDINSKLYERLEVILADFNNEMGYDYILGYQQGGPVLLCNDSLDLTQDIIQALNEAYQSENASEEGD